MRTYTVVVERCADTGLFVGYVPGFAGAHSQGESLDELNKNLQEVIQMLLEEGEPSLDSQFVGTQTVTENRDLAHVQGHRIDRRRVCTAPIDGQTKLQ